MIIGRNWAKIVHMQENTLANRGEFNTSLEPQIRSAPMANGYQANQGDVVFFQCDLTEMFGINLDYPGIRGALNQAFYESKRYIPVDTGLMKSSYTMRPLSDTLVELFFDPAKIIGQERKGQTVKEYYPKWVGSSGSSNSAWNWLTIVMNHFYDRLIKEVRSLSKAKEAKEREEVGRTAISVTDAAIAIQATLNATEKAYLKAQVDARKQKRLNDLAEAKRQKEIRDSVSSYKEV